MKRYAIRFLLITGLLSGLMLNGCRDTALSGQQKSLIGKITLSMLFNKPAALSAYKTSPSTVIQGGPYGQLALTIPSGWNCETFPMDNEQLTVGLYGLRFYPEDAAKGYIELTYADWFGVCGTGLIEQEEIIAGSPAQIGTYDNNVYWNFISFQEDYKGIVALTYDVDSWWETYNTQVMDILDTLTFDTTEKEGGAFQYSAESECNNIALSLTLKNISPSGATLVFHCYDANAPTGDLEYGEDFVLEVQKDGLWQKVPVALEGNYAFHEVAYMLPPEGITEQTLTWKWLYGTLAPGTYRIQKSILDFRNTGDFDKYTVYAQFILN